MESLLGESGTGMESEVPLDVGVMIQAMSECVAFYHQTHKIEFYAMVAEEYGTLRPEWEDIPVSIIGQKEEALHELAVELARSTDLTRISLPQDVKPHLERLLVFYKTVGVIESTKNDVGPDSALGPASPHESVLSGIGQNDGSAGQTDASTSNPVTPVEGQVEGERPTSQPPSALPTVSSSVTSMPSTVRAVMDPSTSRFAYHNAHSVLEEMTKAFVSSKQHLREQEELLKSAHTATEQRKLEYTKLKAIVKQYRQREEERKRIRGLLEDDEASDDDAKDSEVNASIQEMRKLYRKELKRARRLQESLTLKFQLLQSENQRHEMKTEQLIAQLRNEYTDAYVFPNVSLS